MDLLTLVLAHAIRNTDPADPAATPMLTLISDGTDAGEIEPWQPFITEASRRFALPESWIERVMRAESGGHMMLNGSPITSPAGAMGLMQLMPATYAEMRMQYGLGPDPYDPHDNILAGAAYLREMRARFSYPGLFAAYNAGPTRYQAFLAGEKILPEETRAYLSALVSNGNVLAGAVRASASGVGLMPGGGLFFVLRATEIRTGITSKTMRDRALPPSLFVPLRKGVSSESSSASGVLFVPLSRAPR